MGLDDSSPAAGGSLDERIDAVLMVGLRE